MEYDYIIVGAGIAGLHCALRISKAFPKAKIAIAEMYNYTGGRIFTFHGASQWEAGAGRIHGSHTMIMKYLKDYGLTTIPIGGNAEWHSSIETTKDIWPSLSEALVTSLKRVDTKVLATHTIKDLVLNDPLLHRFPYNAEVSTMRADLAIKSFENEMGSNDDFYVVKEGLSELTDRIKATLMKRGVKFLYNHRLVSVDPLYFEITNKHSKYVTITANKAILAVHSDALKKIKPFSNHPILKHLKMQPLLRTYGVFKKPITMNKTVTDSRLRYIIPVGKHTLMTSYTDADDTKVWKKIYDKGGDKALCHAIMADLRKMFPDIESPTFFKSHYWQHGCTYWLPGLYDPEEESHKIMCPIPIRNPNLYVCGESYSMKQAWIEGALEHAEEMLQKYIL
jgi:protoporphyrinogen oxidase